MGECGKTSGSLSCPLVAPLSRLVGMNGYNSVILCKPTLHSGKGLQGRLSYRLARTQTSLQLRVGEHLTAEPRTRVRDVAVHPEHAAEEENLRTDAVNSRRQICRRANRLKRRAQLTVRGRQRLEPWECHAHSLACQPDPEQESGVQGTRVRRLSRAYT